MQKYNTAYQIEGSYDFSALIYRLEGLIKDTPIKFVKKQFSSEANNFFQPIPPHFKIAIIDFEGNPIFLCGLLIRDILLTFYIEDYSYKIELYKLILTILKIAGELTFFAFSDHERIELLKIYLYLKIQSEDVSKFSFIERFPIINLQKDSSPYESLTEAIYSLHPHSLRSTGDALFRNSRMVDKLFRAQKFNEIILHNRNCLQNEAILFLKRWYKNYKI